MLLNCKLKYQSVTFFFYCSTLKEVEKNKFIFSEICLIAARYLIWGIS
jgi:hypothetical protein